MSVSAKRRLNGSLIVILFAALGFIWSLPAKAQDTAPPVDLTALPVPALMSLASSPWSAPSVAPGTWWASRSGGRRSRAAFWGS